MENILAFIKKLFRNKVFCVLFTACLLLFAAYLTVIHVPTVKYAVRDQLNRWFPDRFPYHIYYQNNVPCYRVDEVDFTNCDVREVQVGNNRTYLINHSRGFALGFPRDAQFDFSAAQEYIPVTCEAFSAVISKEYSTYPEGVENSKQYVADYFHKYMLDETFIRENNITVHQNKFEQIGDFPVQIVALSRTPAAGSEIKDNTYVYAYIYTDTIVFYRVMFKSNAYTDELMQEVYNTLNSFSTDVEVKGISDTFTDFKPVIPQNWNEETRALYASLTASERCKWGIFTPRAVGGNDFTDIHALEEKIGAKFDGVLEYTYHFDEIPVAGMQTAYEEGKIIELTLQTSTVMNENLEGHNPVFDVLDGLHDEKLRKMARDIKGFGHPVLFRLNNEMNSDWTSYSGAACLTDPEIYVQVWRRIYDIFASEDVDNTIWIFNPNDENFPPAGYNTSIAYYPGDEYVQVFGITGYNTGTYYEELNGEHWRTFDEIYTKMEQRYLRTYGAFPWVITEFASSSIGGDKEQWIADMFQNLSKFPNIKMAFWFNSADYDERPETNGNVARPYWFDETPGTTAAFAKGIKQQ